MRPLGQAFNENATHIGFPAWDTSGLIFMGQQCAAAVEKANLILGCINRSVQRKTWEVIVLPYSAPVSSSDYEVIERIVSLQETASTTAEERFHVLETTLFKTTLSFDKFERPVL